MKQVIWIHFSLVSDQASGWKKALFTLMDDLHHRLDGEVHPCWTNTHRARGIPRVSETQGKLLKAMGRPGLHLEIPGEIQVCLLLSGAVDTQGGPPHPLYTTA